MGTLFDHYLVKPEYRENTYFLFVNKLSKYVPSTKDARTEKIVRQLKLESVESLLSAAEMDPVSDSLKRTIEIGVEQYLLPISVELIKILDGRRSAFVKSETKKKNPFENLIVSKGAKITNITTDYVLAKSKILSGGSFGCVLAIQVKTGQEHKFKGQKSVAVKFESIETATSMLNNAEIYASFQAGKLQDYPRINPFALSIYRFYRIPFTVAVIKSVGAISAMPDAQKCEILTDMPKTVKAGAGKNLQVIEMELSKMGELFGQQIVFSVDQIRNMVFQLFYSMIAMNKKIGILHKDIKAQNILIDDKGGSDPVLYRFHVDGGINFQIRIDAALPYIFRYTDFGLASSDLFGTTRILKASSQPESARFGQGTPIFIPPEYALYYNAGKTVENQVVPPRNTGSEVWALGLVIAGVALNGWSLEKIGFSRALRIFLDIGDDDKVFWAGDLVSVLSYDRDVNDFIKKMQASIRKKYPGIAWNPDSHPSPDDNKHHQVDTTTINLFIANILLHQELGLDLLPKKEPRKKIRTAPRVLESLKFGDYYRYVDANLAQVQDSGRKWKSPPTTRGKPEDHNIFYHAVEYMKTTIGSDGIDFIKKCLAWSYEEREEFGRLEYNPTDPTKRWFTHPFMKKFLVTKFDYTPQDVPSEDYFLF